MDPFRKINDFDKKLLLKALEATSLHLHASQSISSAIRMNHVFGIVDKGYVQIIKSDYYGNKIILEELYKNAVFGSILSFTINDECEILAKDESDLIFFDASALYNRQNEEEYYRQFKTNLLEIFTMIIALRNERIRILTNKTIRNKLLDYFELLSKKSGSTTIRIPFTFTDMADYLAIDRSAMTRELKKMKEEKVIQIETKSRKIKLLSR